MFPASSPVIEWRCICYATPSLLGTPWGKTTYIFRIRVLGSWQIHIYLFSCGASPVTVIIYTLQITGHWEPCWQTVAKEFCLGEENKNWKHCDLVPFSGGIVRFWGDGVGIKEQLEPLENTLLLFDPLKSFYTLRGQSTSYKVQGEHWRNLHSGTSLPRPGLRLLLCARSLSLSFSTHLMDLQILSDLGIYIPSFLVINCINKMSCNHCHSGSHRIHPPAFLFQECLDSKLTVLRFHVKVSLNRYLKSWDPANVRLLHRSGL